ncbi:MAG: hypothetical protein ACK5Z5_02335 [Neisseriaceae bacterium]
MNIAIPTRNTNSYIYPQKQQPYYFRDAQLLCFNKSTDFIRHQVSTSWKSTTADNVNKKESGITEQQINTFMNQRYSLALISQQLEEINKQIEFIKSTQCFPYDQLYDLELMQENLMQEKDQVLTKLKQNKVLNCGEFAAIASCIESSGILQPGYTTHLAHLNNLKKVSPEYDKTYFPGTLIPNAANHDHAFVAIVNKYTGKEYVVDLWQSVIEPHKKAFIGTMDDYIRFLNSNPDGRYINFSGVKREHIQ